MASDFIGDDRAVCGVKIDTIKAITTFGTVATVVIGGMAAIVLLDMNPDKLAICAGLVGAALSFLTNGETANRTARAIVSSQSVATNGHGRTVQESMTGS